MSLFNPVPQEQLPELFTHYGMAFGLVPVYIDFREEYPAVCVRNGIPDCVLDFFEAIWITVGLVASVFDRDFDRESRLLWVTGEIR